MKISLLIATGVQYPIRLYRGPSSQKVSSYPATQGIVDTPPEAQRVHAGALIVFYARRCFCFSGECLYAGNVEGKNQHLMSLPHFAGGFSYQSWMNSLRLSNWWSYYT